MDTLQITSFDQVPQGLNLLLQRVNELIELQKAPAPIQPNEIKEVEEFLTRDQAAERLKISLPTLNELTKAGKLPGYRIGNRLRYKAGDIDKALTIIKTSKIIS